MKKTMALMFTTSLIACVSLDTSEIIERQRREQMQISAQIAERERNRPLRELQEIIRFARQENNCNKVLLVRSIPYGSDGRRPAYELNVCDTRRNYRWILNPRTGVLFISDTTNRTQNICELMITSSETNILRIFYLRSFNRQGFACINQNLVNGWRLFDTRTVHNGDPRNGWGEEVTFTR